MDPRRQRRYSSKYVVSLSHDRNRNRQKKYVLIPEKEYQALQLRAARKTKPARLLSVAEARAYSKKLIRKWAEKR